MLAPGDVCIVRGLAGTVTLRSIEEDTASVAVKAGRGITIKRFKLAELLPVGANTPVDGPENVELVGTEASGADGHRTLDLSTVFAGRSSRFGTLVVQVKRDVRPVVAAAGRLTVRDPVLFDDAAPFVAATPGGTFPLLLAWTDRRVAAAMVQFEDRPATRWGPAWIADDHVPRHNTVSVDSGRVAFGDLDGGPRVIIPSGAGDGGYPVFLGFCDDALVALAVDFGILWERFEVAIAFPGLERSRSGTLRSALLDEMNAQVRFECFERRIVVQLTQEEGCRAVIDGARFVDAEGTSIGTLVSRGSSGATIIHSSFELLFWSAIPAGTFVLVLHGARPLEPTDAMNVAEAT